MLEGQALRRFLLTPEWSGNASLNYRNPELFDLFFGATYTGSMVAVNQEEDFINRSTRTFWVFDTTISRRFALDSRENGSTLQLQAGVRNLFDQRQRDLSSGPERDAEYRYGPLNPRTFFIRATLEF